MSLSIRIFIWLWVALLAVGGLMLVWPKLMPLGPQQLDEKLTEYKQSQIKKLTRMLSRGEKKKKWLKHRQVMRDGTLVWLYDETTQQFTSDKLPPELIEKAMGLLEQPETLVEPLGRHWVMGPIRISAETENYTAFLGLPDHITRGAWLRQMVRQSPLLLACVALMFGGLAFLVARQIVKPLASLRRTANQIAAGEFTAEVAPDVLKRSDEIGSLGRSVSSMGQTIDDALAAHKRLLSDVSHELRSPLTRLSLANTLAEKRAGETDESKRIAHEADVLNGMIEQLLSLSRMQLMPEHEREPVAVLAIISQCLDNLRFSHPELNLTLNNQLQADDIQVVGNADLFKRAISNVLDNASRYAESTIALSLSQRDERIVIEFSDDGCGVPENELTKLFEPFYRPEFARDRSRGGAGLGLAIVAQAVKFHGGQVVASQAEQGGLRVTLELPRQAR